MLNRFIVYSWMLLLCLVPRISHARPDMWNAGPVASGADSILMAQEPMVFSIPIEVAKLVTQRTALYYFSPTCPHCQAVIGEIKTLHEQFPEVQWVGIATSHSSIEFIEAFQASYAVPFPILHDVNGDFALATGARATPNVYIVEPIPNPAPEQASPVQEGTALTKDVQLVDVYLPYTRGMAGILKLRNTVSEEPFVHFEGYQGNRTCMACHVEEGKSYLLTHHAQAYATLYKMDKVEDEKCVSCHVVGLGDETGFQLGDHNSPLGGVGCESCHSASGPHDGKNVDASKTCVSCHDAEHSIQFSLEKGLPHIDHFAAVGMSDEEIRERVNAISEGTAEKPLLAFPKGETVGDARCVTCHETSHPNDPHRNSMDTLKRKDRKSSECLQCHALSKAFSDTPMQAPKTVGDYWGQAVGCESCHGAGAEHVANPNKDNIVGLGASCPVCVLESMCTSCHTPKWDANWDLDTRMQLYRK